MKHLLGIAAFLILPIATIWAMKKMHDIWFSAPAVEEDAYPDRGEAYFDHEEEKARRLN